MKKRTIILIIFFNTALAAVLIFAQIHPCNCLYLQVLNQSPGDMEVTIIEERGVIEAGGGVLWRGQVPQGRAPIKIKATAAHGGVSYIVSLKEGDQKITTGPFGYDDPAFGDQNLFVITHEKKLQYYIWPNWDGDLGSFVSGVIYVLGDLISCPLQKIGLSPRSIPDFE